MLLSATPAAAISAVSSKGLAKTAEICNSSRVSAMASIPSPAHHDDASVPAPLLEALNERDALKTPGK